jgi:hypothetical protein
VPLVLLLPHPPEPVAQLTAQIALVPCLSHNSPHIDHLDLQPRHEPLHDEPAMQCHYMNGKINYLFNVFLRFRLKNFILNFLQFRFFLLNDKILSPLTEILNMDFIWYIFLSLSGLAILLNGPWVACSYSNFITFYKLRLQIVVIY